MRRIDPDAVYNAEDIAELLDIQVQTVRRLIRTGELAGKKLARRWFVTGRVLQDYFESTDKEIQDAHRA